MLCSKSLQETVLSRSISKTGHIAKKTGNDIVTSADLEIERSIIENIVKWYPDDEILSEETSQERREQSKATWIIDPIDGTINFASGLPFYATSLYLREPNATESGAIVVPALDSVYRSRSKKPSLRNGHEISVSDKSDLSAAVITVNLTSHYTHEETSKTLRLIDALGNKVRGVRVIVCASLELSWVAEGTTDAFVSLNSDPYGTMAGCLLVRGGHGIVTDTAGKALDKDSRSIIASNGHLHDALLNLVHQVLR